jgi:hypothetical protein
MVAIIVISMMKLYEYIKQEQEEINNLLTENIES